LQEREAMSNADTIIGLASHLLSLCDGERLTNREIIALASAVRDESDEAMAVRAEEFDLAAIPCDDTPQ
jgi:hypothetical protein